MILTGEDSVSASSMSIGRDVYVGYEAGHPGYVNGSYNNYATVVVTFPTAKHLSVGRDVIDIEPGLASVYDAPGFVRQWKPLNTNKPVLYASESVMPSLTSVMLASAIPRTDYYLWVALWDNNPAIPAGYDAKQYANASGYDSDSFEDYMFTGYKPPNVLPGIPGGMKETVQSPLYAVSLNWNAVSNPMANGIKGDYHYQVELYKGSGQWELIREQASPAITSALVYGIQGGKVLRWRVSGGNWSDWQEFQTP